MTKSTNNATFSHFELWLFKHVFFDTTFNVKRGVDLLCNQFSLV